MNDGYEVKFKLDPKSAAGANGGNADPDGDGLTNLQEQTLGSDPLDPASPLSALTLQTTDEGLMALRWVTVPGHRYDLQSSDRLTGAWTSVLGFPRMAASLREEQVITNLTNTRFYRTRLAP